jgi:quercetin dioxygenase-like cupin family protein
VLYFPFREVILSYLPRSSRPDSFAVPASMMAQDAMKNVNPDELVWKDDPNLPKGAQTAVLIGDPSKAETIVLRVKFPPHFKVPPHNHTWSEVVTVLSGTCWNGMGNDMEKGVVLKPGSVFVLPANHTHQIWTTDEEAMIQVQFTGPGNITYINPADDEIWVAGEWSVTVQGQKGSPVRHTGYFSAFDVREGDSWKIRMTTFNVTPTS